MVKMRRGWFRIVVAGTLTVCLLVYLNFYIPSGKSSQHKNAKETHVKSRSSNQQSRVSSVVDLLIPGKGQGVPNPKCLELKAPKTDINTVDQYQQFDFQPSWMRSKEFWDTNFEKRYLLRRTKWKKFPLKVILLPHSHNDPGWLKTFEEYYFHQTSRILNSLVEKLNVHTNMTFVWSEVSFLSLWYDRALPKMREQMKALLKSGRFEVATGGWVMTDEANAHLYAMVSQLIEGRQWLHNAFDYQPKNGWSIDVFGHGAAVPYLLKESGIDTTVVQRLHFAWKQWLAEKQSGDFLWRQVWDDTGESDLLTHNRPYDIYSIKHSCGPHPQTCLNFDFRKVFGEYTEYSIKAVNIDDRNVKVKSELLLDQYGRTGSLVPHNVVLVPLGDDFRYDHATEWDQQYTNYQRIIEFINGNKNYYAEIQWGTLADYFKAVKERSKSFPTLKGDFHVYSDIFSEGRPAYWSGYYTTRPYFKILSRQLEAALHVGEMLYTWAWNSNNKKRFNKVAHVLEKDYERLVKSRRSLGLFQHHDAITGTSKSYVMHDYALKLHEGIRETFIVISHASFSLLASEPSLVHLQHETNTPSLDYIQPTFEQLSYEKPRKIIPIHMNKPIRLLVLANSLGQRRQEMVKLIVDTVNLRLTNEFGQEVPFQINPIWNNTEKGMVIVSSQFELFFLADVPPLSLVSYALHRTKEPAPKISYATIFSNFYGSSVEGSSSTPFDTKKVLPGDIQLESDTLKLLFDGTTGMIRSITDKSSNKITQLLMKYAAYPSAQFKSGAYLFKPDPNANKPEEDVLAGAKAKLFIQSGPIASELTVMFGSVLLHTYRIFHVNSEPLSTAIYMENSFNLDGHQYSSKETPGFSPQYRETEMFFRFSTDLNNGPLCRFYTDQGGLNMQERLKVERIGIQGNYYPVTTATYIEDEISEPNRRRLTLLVDHAVGAASWKSGWLESMVERRMYYDDARGMGEGVTDQKRTVGRYWLLLEHLQEEEQIAQLSLAAHHLSNSLNYPVVPLILEGLESDAIHSAAHLVNRPFPCSLHLLSLRTMAQPQYPQFLPENKAMMVIQHQSASCVTTSSVSSCRGLENFFVPEMNFTIPINEIEETDLVGIKKLQRLNSLADLTVRHHKLRTVVLTFPN